MSYIIELDTGAVKEQHVIESYVAVTDFMSVYIMPLLWRKKILVIRIEDNTFITKNVDFIYDLLESDITGVPVHDKTQPVLIRVCDNCEEACKYVNN